MDFSGISYGDGFWQGFIKTGFDVIIDLGETDLLRHTRINFYKMEVLKFGYQKILIFHSNERDGDFETVATFSNSVIDNRPGTFVKSFEWNGSQQARFVRITATINPLVRGWIFADEIVVW